MSVVTANRRPTRLSGGVAVVLALASLGLVGGDATVWSTLFVAGVGLGLLTLGSGIRGSHGLVGLGLSVVGGGVVLLAVGLAATEPSRLGVRLWLGAGLVGVVCVAAGVIPLRAKGSRRLLRGGAVLLFATVLLGGLLSLAELGTLLVAGVAALLTWDVGENAISVGEQLGRATETVRIELAHLFFSVVVGTVAVVAGLVVSGVESPSLSLGGFLILLLAVVLFAVALRN